MTETIPPSPGPGVFKRLRDLEALGIRPPKGYDLMEAEALEKWIKEKETSEEVRGRIEKLESRKAEEEITSRCAELTTTDDGNALRLVEWYGKEIRYDHTGGRWLIWDGVRWRPDQDGRIIELARDVARRITGEARILKDEAGRMKWAGSSLEARRLKNMVELARTDRRVAILGDILDRDPWKMGLLNGTVDLRTGTLLPPSKEDMITRTAGVLFVPGAPCPMWESHIRKVCNDDPELIRYIHVSLGYSTLGINPKMYFFVIWGDGQNGKSVTFRAIKSIFGDYAHAADPGTFEVRKYDPETRDDIVQLKGMRFVVSFETQKGRRLAENLIKAMTGGDELKKRGLYSRPEIFTLPAKVFLCTNYKPRTRDHSVGWWERFRMIPFLHFFPEEERDRGIDARLAAEGPGIFQWLLRGLKDYQENGFPKCAKVDEAIKEYRETQEGDIGQWLHEKCMVEKGAQITRANARRGFVEWCRDGEGEEVKEPMSTQEFTRELDDRGFGSKMIKGTRYWIGFRFKTPEELGEQATL